MYDSPLYKWRRRHRLTQEQAASLMGCKQGTWSKWERFGVYSMASLLRLHEVTGLSYEELIAHQRRAA